MTKEALKLALEALKLAQDNLRDHGDNCFLHDEGEYNRCFCGKDSLSNHLQSVVEKLDEALAQPEQDGQCKHCTDGCPACDARKLPEQEPVAWMNDMGTHIDLNVSGRGTPLYTTPPQRKPLTDEQIRKAKHHMVEGAYDYSFKQGVKWAEYKHGIEE